MKKIMFICTGNVCRSAMAHAYMQHIVNNSKNKNEYLISSCGIDAIPGERSTNNAIKTMEEYSISLENHRATNIRDIDIENYDVILCMTTFHKINVLSLHPKLEGRIFTLKEYVDNNTKYKNIDDPWGFDINVYKDCAKEIVENVHKLLNKLEEGE